MVREGRASGRVRPETPRGSLPSVSDRCKVFSRPLDYFIEGAKFALVTGCRDRDYGRIGRRLGRRDAGRARQVSCDRSRLRNLSHPWRAHRQA